MALPEFNEIVELSNVEISQQIIKTQKELFDLRFKKATRQPYNSHEMTKAKRRIAQLKTLLTSRFAPLPLEE